MLAKGFITYCLKYFCRKVTCAAYVNQTNLNGKLNKNWRAKQMPSKNLGGHDPPKPPLEPPLLNSNTHPCVWINRASVDKARSL